MTSTALPSENIRVLSLQHPHHATSVLHPFQLAVARYNKPLGTLKQRIKSNKGLQQPWCPPSYLVSNTCIAEFQTLRCCLVIERCQSIHWNQFEVAQSLSRDHIAVRAALTPWQFTKAKEDLRQFAAVEYTTSLHFSIEGTEHQEQQVLFQCDVNSVHLAVPSNAECHR